MSNVTIEPAFPIDDSARLDNAPRWRIYLVLAVIVLYCEIATLQATMLGNAVRYIAPSFPSAGANITWISIIFGLVGGIVTPFGSKLSDLIGKKKVMFAGGIVFLVGTVICFITSNWPLFLVGRALQSVAIVAPAIAYGLVRDLMPRRLVPVGVGLISTGFGLSAFVAPLLGGWLLDHFSWRSMFVFMIIYMVVLAPPFLLWVPETKVRMHQSLDWVGCTLLGGGVGLALLYLSVGSSWGWSSASALLVLVGGIAALVAFVIVEQRLREPMVDLRLLVNPKVSLVLACGLLLGCVIGMSYAISYLLESPTAAQLSSTVLLQARSSGLPAQLAAHATVVFNSAHTGAGYSALKNAVYNTMWSGIAGMVFGVLLGAASRRIGARIPAIIAGIAALASMLLYFEFHVAVWQYVVIAVITGIFSGAYYSALPNLIVDAVPADQQGVSGGMLGVVNSLGTSIGTAILTAIFASHELEFELRVPGVPAKVTAPHGFQVLSNQLYTENGYRTVWLIGAGIALAAILVAVAMRHGRAPATGGAISHLGDNETSLEGIAPSDAPAAG